MKIISGISDGALLQRDDHNQCHVTVALEVTGTPVCHPGLLTPLRQEGGVCLYTLSGIPVGGPHTITLTDEENSITLNIWVGDLWILAGQSNMEGAARPDAQDVALKANPDPSLRGYYLDNRWDAAVPILHEPWLSVDACQRETFENYQITTVWKSKLPPHLSHGKPEIGVCSGLFFAQRMKELTGVPQGVIPCAMGGSHLRAWQPQDTSGDNLYAAMLRRFHRTGAHVKGILWHQGEAQTGAEDAPTYQEDMKKLIGAMRRDFHAPHLPVVIGQIAGTSLPFFCNDDCAALWNSIREQQRTLEEHIPHLTAVSTLDCSRDDLIHLSSSGQKSLGYRYAESMAWLLGMGSNRAPVIRHMAIEEDPYRITLAMLKIEFDHADGLHFIGKPQGFSLCDTPEEPCRVTAKGIGRIEANGNTVCLYTEYSLDAMKEKFLCYGCGIDPNGNLVTEGNQAVLAMGPLRISEYF